MFKSELGELPGRPAAIPCNVRESLQPVNQLEAGMADESAGVLLPFLHGGILSYFLLIFLKRFTVFSVLKCYSFFCPIEKLRLLQLRGATFAKFSFFHNQIKV